MVITTLPRIPPWVSVGIYKWIPLAAKAVHGIHLRPGNERDITLQERPTLDGNDSQRRRVLLLAGFLKQRRPTW